MSGDWTLENILVSDLYKNQVATILEDAARARLMEGFPSQGSEISEYERYRDSLVDLGPFQISRCADGTFSIAEGNHRVLIFYEELIQNGILPDFTVPVNVRKVDYSQLHHQTLDRAMGKPEAMHFRLLLDVNLMLCNRLEELGYVLPGDSRTDYTLINELLKRIGAIRGKEAREGIIIDPLSTKTFGSLNELAWTYQEMIAGFVESNYHLDDIREFLSGLMGESRKVSDALGLFMSDSLGTYLNKESVQAHLESQEPRSVKITNLMSLLDSAVRRTAREILTGIIEDAISIPLANGSGTYGSFIGYSDIMKIISEGSLRAGIPFRDVIEILGGRKYGSGSSSYGPVKDAYLSLRTIPEPDRTRMVTYALRTTYKMRAKRDERRMLFRVLREGYNEQPLIDRQSYLDMMLGFDSHYVTTLAAYLWKDGLPKDAIYQIIDKLETFMPAQTSCLEARNIGLWISEEIFSFYGDLIDSHSDHLSSGRMNEEDLMEDACGRIIETLDDLSADIVAIKMKGGFEDPLEIEDDLASPDNGKEKNKRRGYKHSMNGLWVAPIEFEPNLIQVVPSYPVNGRKPIAVKGLDSKLFGQVLSLMDQGELHRRVIQRGKMVNLVPEYIIALCPEDPIILALNIEGKLNPIARFEDPLFIDTRYIVSCPGVQSSYDLGKDGFLTRFWLYNPIKGGKGFASIYACNAFCTEVNDTEFRRAYFPSLTQMLPLYEKLTSISL